MIYGLSHFGWVFLGGGIGSALRFGVGRVALPLAGPSVPLGPLIVNVLGCMAIGVLAEWLALRDTGIGISTKLFLTTGLLGGFTTFSAFTLDAVTHWERGETVATVAYVAGSVILSIAGLSAGMALTRALLGSP